MSILLNKIKLFAFKIKWKKNNKHNYTSPSTVFDGNRVKVGRFTYGYINAITYPCDNSELSIGDFCSIGGNVTFILGGEHNYKTFSTYPFGEKLLKDRIDTISKGKIVVDDDVWLGHGSTILSGTHIGQGAIVASGSVVTKDVPPYAIVGGIPANVIKYRFQPEIIEELLKVDYSKLTKEMIESHIDDFYQILTDTKQLERMPKKADK